MPAPHSAPRHTQPPPSTPTTPPPDQTCAHQDPGSRRQLRKRQQPITVKLILLPTSRNLRRQTRRQVMHEHFEAVESSDNLILNFLRRNWNLDGVKCFRRQRANFSSNYMSTLLQVKGSTGQEVGDVFWVEVRSENERVVTYCNRVLA